MVSFTIERRFCGPPNSGNGGYVCGMLGKQIDGPSEVMLRLPPPLETPLDIRMTADGALPTAFRSATWCCFSNPLPTSNSIPPSPTSTGWELKPSF